MAITSSAKKAIRAGARKAVFNARRKKELVRTEKDVQKLVRTKKFAEARVALAPAYQAIDKAAKTHLITDNAAARMKSRISAFVKRATLAK